ncbi:hypothetical protein VKA52_13825 [Halobacillus sp. HZG1]|uniref:hypothetical protein n=1 Tax=Halobacillus sp. HZG1 TaxID=3111769 RepID=UPI002DBB61AB|nr:hypothetical protein [Halobacillus sp. HZG1]MEC3884808.1 hypothetical protein [Halobacillus sp. HZG1]
MEEALKQESVDQKKVRNKARSSMWYLFLLMVLCIGFGQIFFNMIQGLFYLGAVIFYGSFLYETYMSRKTNEELWQIWDERWRDRRFLFQFRSSLSKSIEVLFPAILGANASWLMFGLFLVIGLATGFRQGIQKWKAKEHYYQEYLEDRGMAA